MVRTLGRRIARRLATLPPLAVLALAWSILIVYAYPGLMTQDSFDHLREARDRVYSDGHPPAINLLWAILDYIVAGPLLMIVVQTVCFLAGLYLVLRRAFSPRPAAWIAAAVFLFPPITVPFAVVWKDPLMAGFLMLGFAGLVSARSGARLAGLVAMFLATAVRYNAITATLPLVVLLYEWRPGLHWLKRYAIALVAWAAVTFGAFKLNDALTDHRLHLWHSIAVFDIVGTLAFVDEDLPDDRLRALFEGTELLVTTDIHATARELYTPRDFLPITNHPTKTMWALPINGYVAPPEAQRDAITRAWKETLATWPIAYLKHRMSVMGEVICVGSRATGAIPRREFKYPDYASKDLGLAIGWSKLQHKLTRAYVWIVRHTPLFTVWVYLVISLLLLPLARRDRDMLALILSGLAFEAPLFVLAPSPDFRYSHWMIVCAMVAAVVLTARRAAGTQLGDRRS